MPTSSPEGSSAVVADLHVHTTASDGRYSPAECVAKANALGLAALAVTDHDTMGGVAEAIGAAAPSLKIIPALEFGCHWDNRPEIEIHVIGYGCDQRQAELAAELTRLRDARSGRAAAMVAKLTALGLPVSLDDVMRCAAGGTVGRPHIAQAMLERGHVTSISDAFARYLAPGMPGYVEHYRPSPAGAIKLIRASGGVAVLAHPGLIGNDGIVSAIIAAGVEGLEVWHPQHTPEAARHYLRLADQRALLATGGSDFHGIAREGPELGSAGVPRDRLDALLTALRQH